MNTLYYLPRLQHTKIKIYSSNSFRATKLTAHFGARWAAGKGLLLNTEDEICMFFCSNWPAGKKLINAGEKFVATTLTHHKFDFSGILSCHIFEMVIDYL